MREKLYEALASFEREDGSLRQFNDEGINIANAIEDVKAPSLQSEGHSYNMSGQRVGKNYKGIVIKNGKKYLVK